MRAQLVSRRDALADAPDSDVQIRSRPVGSIDAAELQVRSGGSAAVAVEDGGLGAPGRIAERSESERRRTGDGSGRVVDPDAPVAASARNAQRPDLARPASGDRQEYAVAPEVPLAPSARVEEHWHPQVAERRGPAAAPVSPLVASTGRGLTITAEGLDKSFGDHAVLRGLDFAVPAGQFVAIVGRSGCGKSTLLRLLLGLDQPSGGRLWLGDGADPGAGRGASTKLGLGDVRIVFQEPRLLPWARVLANVEVGLGSERRSAEARARALAALREVGLDDRRGDWPGVLSGGQRQRVALARALISRPRVLAFDEPLGALDALTRIAMQQLLERVWLDQGFTAILVTHDVAEAVTLADRVLILEHGRIALDAAIDLPRPRRRGAAEVAALEGQILRALLDGSSHAPG